MKKINKFKVKNILFITLSNIGDIVLTTPTLEALIGEFPDGNIDVLTGPSGEEIFKKHKKVREVILYKKKASPGEKFKLLLALRKKKYDLIVDLKNTMFPLLLGAKYITNIFRHVKKEVMHKKDSHLLRLEEIGLDTSKASFYIPLDEDDKKYIEGIINELHGREFVVIAPGAKSHVKRWPLKNFAKLCDMIKNELGHEVILVGSQDDRVVIERILFYTKTLAINLIEKTNIGQFAFLLLKSKLLVTNDSAPLHIASAMDVPTLTFFGPTDDKKYGPLTKAKSKVMKKDIKCSPCEVPQCINFKNKYECLKTISPEEAFTAVKELL